MDNDKNRVDLSLDELDMVMGGTDNSADQGGSPIIHFCKKCNKDQIFKIFSGTRDICTVCGTPFTYV